jgi:Flp pilus assembly protein TadG
MKIHRKSKGQSILEFALVFPLIFLLITGLFDLGRAVFYFSTLNTAVREGTRFAIVQPKGTDNSAIETKIKSYFFDIKELINNCSIANSCIVITRIGTTTDPKIQIKITYNFVPITPGMKLILGHGVGIPIHVQSVMRLAPVAQ